MESYLNTFNQCGRVLLKADGDMEGSNENQDIPLWIWPIVLERVQKMVRRNSTRAGYTTRRKELESSVLYQLLRGPAFLNRSFSRGSRITSLSEWKRKIEDSKKIWLDQYVEHYKKFGFINLDLLDKLQQ